MDFINKIFNLAIKFNSSTKFKLIIINMENKEEVDELINILSKYGYDMLVKDNTITLLKDGYVKTIPLDNTIKLMEDDFFPIPINDVALLLMSNHKTSKEIYDGKYDDLKPMSKQEINDILYEILKNKNDDKPLM